nr:restriction endonuclease subunit S [Deinococcus sp. RM]RIY03887.1 restriction endonuclease subunit S [Deinococcus sp. RM]
MNSKEQDTRPVPAPRLRFPGFVGEWEEKKLGQVCAVLNNLRRPITGSQRVKGDYPYYGASGIVDYVAEYIFDEPLLLVGEDGAKWGAFEKTAFIAEGKYWVNNHAHVLKPLNSPLELIENYLSMIDLGPYVTGAAPPKLTLGKLKNIPIPLPPTLPEQTRIAAALSSLDAVIAAHQSKQDALREHKRGLMAGLFPAEGERVPRLRFPEFEGAGEWEEKKLGEVAPLQRGHDLTSSQLVAGDVPVVYSNGIQNHHNTAIAQAPALITGRSGTIGKLHYIESGPYWPHNTTLYVTSFKDNNPKFIYYLYSFIDFTRFASGSGVPTLNRNDAHAFITSIPSLPEQTRIAACLSSLDGLITAQGDHIAALQAFKRGLMQGLFPAAAAGPSTTPETSE